MQLFVEISTDDFIKNHGIPVINYGKMIIFTKGCYKYEIAKIYPFMNGTKQ